MKWQLLIALMLTFVRSMAQAPNFNGGVYDGFGQYKLAAPSTLYLYKGGSNDGFAKASLNAPSTFNLFKGGANDGFAWDNGYLPVQINMYNGGKNDGFANSGLNALANFNLFKGGSNDGFAKSGIVASNNFTISKGGSNDGFAKSSLNTINSFSFYKGGSNDGFAMAKNIIAPTCGNYPIIQQTTMSNITTNSATFTWNTFNPGATYVLYLYSNGIPGVGTQINTYSALCGNPSNTVNLTNLAPGTYYCLTIAEYCPNGTNSGISASACFTTYPAPCPEPTVLQTLGNTGSSVRLGWTPGSGNTGYEIMLIKQGTTDTIRKSGAITSSPMRDTIKCLPSSSFFHYFIRETCGGNSRTSWIDGFTTYTSPGCSPPANQSNSVVNTLNANLSWESIYTNETNKPYQISYGVGIANASQGTKTPITTITNGQVSGMIRTHALYLAGGVANITWYVREVCGQCDTTAWVGPNTLPVNTCSTPVTNSMSVTALTTNSATLNWTSVNYNSPSKIEVINYGNSSVQTINCAATTNYNRTQAISGLTANTAYGWRVKEYCSVNDSTNFTTYQNFTTMSGSSCNAPTNQGIWVQSGNVLIVKWNSTLYGNSSKSYQIAAGMNITSPAQATINQSNAYYISQTPLHPTHYFGTGNAPGFTWFVRDVCNPGEYSAWLGPYVVGSGARESGPDQIESEITEEISSDFKVQLYPNPTNDNFNIEFNSSMKKMVLVEVFNAQSSKVIDTKYTIDIGNSTMRTSLETFNSGLYFVRITDLKSNQIIYKNRIIKE